MSNSRIKGTTILVVDDEEFIRSLVKQLLTELGASTVLDAENGRQAIDLLATQGENVDCIVSDFKMPDKNGIELLQAIRSGSAKVERNLPFAMLTGYSDKFVLGLAMAMDVDAFIAKPVSKEMLASRLTPLLSGVRQELMPAKTYAKLVMGDSVSDLENRIAMLEKIVRDQAKAVQSYKQDEAQKSSSVWTPKSPKSSKSPGTPDTPEMNATDEKPMAPGVEATADPLWSSVAVTLAAVPEGAVLANDVRTEAGNLVLASGTVLNDRILDKLHHIHDMGEDFGVIYIYE